MIRRVLSKLLFLANSSPPELERERFYAMKTRILRRFGTPDGCDWQRIVKVCFRCGGSGVESYTDYGDECSRCDGSGEYERVYFRLERTRIGGRVFHTPRGRYYDRPDGEAVTIEGRIQHRSPGPVTREAALWLSLAFDRGLFVRLMRCHFPGPYPLCWLSRVLWHLSGRGRHCSHSISGREYVPF